MASIDNGALGSRRNTHAAPRIDMTPMVDLGFLLITFFIFTTSMTESFAMKLTMPKETKENGTVTAASATLSVILSDKGVFVYNGIWNDALRQGRVQQTTLSTYTGIGAVIRQLQKKLAASGRKDELMLLVKPSKTASYTQLIDAIDQALIHKVTRYAIVDADADEAAYATK